MRLVPNDPATAWSVGNTEEDYTKFLKANGVQGKRFGVLRGFFGIAPINDKVNHATADESALAAGKRSRRRAPRSPEASSRRQVRGFGNSPLDS